MEHSFQILAIRLSEVHFSVNQNYQWEENKAIELTHNITVQYGQADETLRVLVSVSSDAENQPFRFSVAWEGSFVFETMPDKGLLDRVAHINCASIIFPYARECVADLTRRASIPPLNLPPFNFVAMYEEKQKSQASAPILKTRKKRST